MRVTVVIAGLAGGGAERLCVNLANAWVAGGRHVTLLTITQGASTSAYPLDSRVERRDVGWPRQPRAEEDTEPILRALEREGCLELAGEAPLMAALRAAVLDTAPDVIVSHMDLTNLRVLAATRGLSIPLVACEHTDPSRVSLGAWQAARERLYRRASAVVASHDATVDWLAARGIASQRIANPLVTPPAARRPSVNGRRLLVSLGRLSPEKRVEMIVRAFARIAGRFPEWDLDIYGDGPLRENIARAIDELALAPRARLRGFTDDPYGVLAGADLYASASCVEGFGNAVWEALACGVPVVAMECGAPLHTLVRDGIDGLTVHGGEGDLSRALAAVMGDEEKRTGFAARASEAAVRFSLEDALRSWDALLGRLVTMVGS
jgi:glycosyltransferase involved in cell wall biosynthesis